MPNKIELIKKYGAEAIIKAIAAGAKSNILELNNKRVKIDVQGAGEVKLFILETDGLADYRRARGGDPKAGHTEFVAGESTGSGYYVGGVTGRWESFKLAFDRGVQFRIDSMDDEEVDGLVMANLTTEFTKTKVIPEIDAIRFSRIAQYTNAPFGNRAVGTIAANTILTKFNAALTYQAEQEVESDSQAFFVSPTVMGLVRNTTELSRKLTQEEYRSESAGVTFTITKYEGRPIVEVPSSRFFTDIAVSATNGFHPSATSKVINFLLVDITSVLPVVKVENLRVFSPEQVQDFDGYKINLRVYHDLFVPTLYRAANYAHVSEVVATSVVNVLRLVLNESAATNSAFQINAFATRPAGLGGDIYYKKTAFNIGDDSSGTKATLNTDIVTAEEELYFALVKDGKVIAASGKLDIPLSDIE